MRSYLNNHVCDADKPDIKEDAVKEDQEEKTKKELVAQAKELNIKGADRMTKYEVIEAINEAESYIA
jgi:hypothetical protein